MYVTVKCSYCKKDIIKYGPKIKPWKHSYCDRECHARHKITSITKKCGNCEKLVTRTKSQASKSKSGHLFCNRSCSTAFNNRFKKGKLHPHWSGGVGSYRARALKKYGARCSSSNCPFDCVDERMLDVDHVDGDRSNNKIENLQVLCVWCHALKTRNVNMHQGL